MKAMVLAAGRGERMRPLSDRTPKPLLQVEGRPLIEWLLHALHGAGITEVVVNLAYRGSQIESALGNGERFDLAIRYSRERDALETGGGIFQALPLLGEQPFWVVNSDIRTDFDFSAAFNLGNDLAHLIMVANPPHKASGDFHLQGDRLVATGEPSVTYSGIGLYSADLFADCEPGKFPLAPLLVRAMKSRRVGGTLYSGVWHDVGTPERLARLGS